MSDWPSPSKSPVNACQLGPIVPRSNPLPGLIWPPSISQIAVWPELLRQRMSLLPSPSKSAPSWVRMTDLPAVAIAEAPEPWPLPGLPSLKV